MFTLFDFRPEYEILVIIISTISMCQNCSISVSADPGGAKYFCAHLGHLRYNYDVQSSVNMVDGVVVTLNSAVRAGEESKLCSRVGEDSIEYSTVLCAS